MEVPSFDQRGADANATKVMYFRALHIVGGSNDLILSEERKIMIQEETNAQLRRNRIDYAYQKARVGEE